MKTSSDNKKVINATKCSYKGINFRSKLEMFCYKKFEEAGIILDYEGTKFILQDKFVYEDELIRQITLTPDFICTYKGVTYIIETKGLLRNDSLLKIKMLKNYLVNHKLNYKFYMPRNQKDVLNLIKLIKHERSSTI